jgi:pimeloyl-ACP methyl ester carboxylesterase
VKLAPDGFFSVGAARLEYTYLHGTRPLTLVLLHEGLGCVGMWRDFPIALRAATQCSVMAYSREGYGRSDQCAVPRPPQYMHDEALRVLPELLDIAGVSPVVLVGHSDGASIALIHAGASPGDRLAGVCAMAPHVFNEDCTVEAIGAAQRAYLEANLRDKLERYHKGRVDGAFWGWNKAWLNPRFRDWNIEEYLPRITAPLIVIQGDDDPYGTMAQVDAISEGVPGQVRVEVLERCGHSPYRDQPIHTLEAIVSFVAGL